MVFSFPLGFKAKQDFLDDSQKLYDSEPATLTDVNDINEWVKKVTNGHISEFLSSLPLSAVMVLINAMHYKGQNKHLLPASLSQFPLLHQRVTSEVLHYSDLLHYCFLVISQV